MIDPSTTISSPSILHTGISNQTIDIKHASAACTNTSMESTSSKNIMLHRSEIVLAFAFVE
jgi:hypothetical protein